LQSVPEALCVVPWRHDYRDREDRREWREELTPEQYEVLRRQGTERAFTGKYWDDHDDGIYRCAGCGAELFDSDTKFDSGSGWPSFTEPKVAEAVELRDDLSHGHDPHRGRLQALRRPPRPRLRRRPARPGGLRYCINSCSLDFDTRRRLTGDHPLHRPLDLVGWAVSCDPCDGGYAATVARTRRCAKRGHLPPGVRTLGT
jgi:peptide-methionine (R)-S-oxide reductase